MTRLLCSVMLILSVAGCGSAIVVPPVSGQSTSPASGEKLEEAKKSVNLDPYLLKECEWFQPMTVKNPTPNQVLDQRALDVAVHAECVKRHNSLVKIVKEAFNVK